MKRGRQQSTWRDTWGQTSNWTRLHHPPHLTHTHTHTHTHTRARAHTLQALSLHLIEGTIDQVDSVVSVSWVASRVLTLEQLGGLKGRLDGWIDKVSAAAHSLEAESVGVEA